MHCFGKIVATFTFAKLKPESLSQKKQHKRLDMFDHKRRTFVPLHEKFAPHSKPTRLTFTLDGEPTANATYIKVEGETAMEGILPWN